MTASWRTRPACRGTHGRASAGFSFLRTDSSMSINSDERPPISRRAALRQACCGFGTLGLAGLLSQLSAAEPANPLAPRAPHFPARAKRVIFLFMHGGPSSVDTFDPKPSLTKYDGQALPFKRPLTFAEGKMGGLMKSTWQFRPHGQR